MGAGYPLGRERGKHGDQRRTAAPGGRMIAPVRRALRILALALGFVVLAPLLLYPVGRWELSRRETLDLDGATEKPGQWVSINESRVHVLEAGSGPPLILVHGFSESTFDWEEHLIPLLAARFHVIAFDLFGMGFSERSPDFDYGFGFWLDQLVATLEALGVDHACVAGHSMGGALSVLLAAEHPHKVQRLVLIAHLAPSLPPANLVVLAVPGVGELVWAHADGHPMVSGFSEAYLSRMRRVVRIRGTGSALLSYLRGGADFARLAAAYPRVAAPTLVMHGSADKSVAYSSAVEAIESIPDRRLVTIDGGGHWLMRDDPRRVADEMERFLLAH
jgi:pimeloyl-ACP methyl ester carboxylesterase